jgi:hypothetical protein
MYSPGSSFLVGSQAVKKNRSKKSEKHGAGFLKQALVSIFARKLNDAR